MKDESNAYWRGRRARSSGQPCAIADDRMTPATRQEWFRGWEVEDGFHAPKLKPDAKATFLARLSELRKSLE